jgi:hypothetical protein
VPTQKLAGSATLFPVLGLLVIGLCRRSDQVPHRLQYPTAYRNTIDVVIGGKWQTP